MTSGAYDILKTSHVAPGMYLTRLLPDVNCYISYICLLWIHLVHLVWHKNSMTWCDNMYTSVSHVSCYHMLSHVSCYHMYHVITSGTPDTCYHIWLCTSGYVIHVIHLVYEMSCQMYVNVKSDVLDVSWVHLVHLQSNAVIWSWIAGDTSGTSGHGYWEIHLVHLISGM